MSIMKHSFLHIVNSTPCIQTTNQNSLEGVVWHTEVQNFNCSVHKPDLILSKFNFYEWNFLFALSHTKVLLVHFVLFLCTTRVICLKLMMCWNIIFFTLWILCQASDKRDIKIIDPWWQWNGSILTIRIFVLYCSSHHSRIGRNNIDLTSNACLQVIQITWWGCVHLAL